MRDIPPEDLAAFAEGAAETVVEDDALRFHRIHAALRPHYTDGGGSQVRMENTACCRIRFRSDASTLALEMRLGRASRHLYRGCVVVGEASVPFGPEGDGHENSTWSGTVEPPGAGERVVDIWLPHLCRTDIAHLAVDDDASVSAAPEHAGRWIVWGDSITQGMTVRLPADMTVGRVARALDLDAINLGVGGGKLDAVLADALPDTAADAASIAYGTNDFNKGLPAATFGENAVRLLDALDRRMPQTRIVLVTTVSWPDREGVENDNGETLDTFRDALVRAAEGRENVVVANGADILPPDRDLFIDGVHPNDAGAAVYADNLLPYIRDALRS